MITIKQLLESFLGSYTTDISGNTSGIAQLDIVWICSFILLALLTSWFFKFIKELFKELFR